jgi:DNA-binding NtrC family response regulator
MTQTHLLYVDNDPGFCVFYQALLRSFGFVVDVAANSVAAMERFNSSDVHAVMISHDLQPSAGERDGFHLAAEIKRRAPEVPVVMVSSCESVVEDAPYFVDGAISKRAPLDQLLRLMQWLTGHSIAQPAFAFPAVAMAASGHPISGLPISNLGQARELRRAAVPATIN